MLTWTASKTAVDPDLLNGTLRDLWKRVSTNKCFVKQADLSSFKLDFKVLVRFNPPDEEDASFDEVS